MGYFYPKPTKFQFLFFCCFEVSVSGGDFGDKKREFSGLEFENFDLFFSKIWTFLLFLTPNLKILTFCAWNLEIRTFFCTRNFDFFAFLILNFFFFFFVPETWKFGIFYTWNSGFLTFLVPNFGIFISCAPRSVILTFPHPRFGNFDFFKCKICKFWLFLLP